MELDTVLDDVAEYNDKMFQNTLDVIDENLEFIEANELFEPKANYIFVLTYLEHTIRHFVNLDRDFLEGTLKKVHRDVENLNKLYNAINDSLSNTEKYKNAFLKSVPMLKSIKSNMENNPNRQEHYTKISELYESCYIRNFIEQKIYILSSLKSILNTKIYYLDSMLWLHALKSEDIVRYLKISSKIDISDGMNSKKYIKFRQKVDLPYTEEYTYLGQCLRIFR